MLICLYCCREFCSYFQILLGFFFAKMYSLIVVNHANFGHIALRFYRLNTDNMLQIDTIRDNEIHVSHSDTKRFIYYANNYKLTLTFHYTGC